MILVIMYINYSALNMYVSACNTTPHLEKQNTRFIFKYSVDLEFTYYYSVLIPSLKLYFSHSTLSLSTGYI